VTGSSTSENQPSSKGGADKNSGNTGV